MTGLKPAGRFEWERLIRRARFGPDHATRAVALTISTYADSDGTKAKLSEERLVNVTELSGRSVRRSLATLRAMGLLEMVANGSRNGQKGAWSEYRLTIPIDAGKRIPMLPPDEGITHDHRPPTADA